jgi:uncharacterized protein (DUF1015 family)
MTEKPILTARDDRGVTHRLWRWTDPKVIATLTQAVKRGDVLIADGHHRYETAWNYLQEHKSRSKKAASKYVMAFLCPLEDSGLVIQPTHRAVRLPVGRPAETFLEQVSRSPSFAIQKIDSLTSMISKLRSNGSQPALGMIMGGGKLFWLKPKPNAGVKLPVVQLHDQILKNIPLENISYNQDPKAAVEAIQRSEANVAFLLPPPDKEAFAKLCKSGRLLPQKSTYFYPKVITGFVMRSLKGDL